MDAIGIRPVLKACARRRCFSHPQAILTFVARQTGESWFASADERGRRIGNTGAVFIAYIRSADWRSEREK